MHADEETMVMAAIDRAAHSKGAVAGRVFCNLCGAKHHPLAYIWETPEGLYLEAELLGGTTQAPAIIQAQQSSGRRFLGARGLVRFLLERDPKWQDRLQAECATHGPADLDPVAVVAAIRSPRGRSPESIVIHAEQSSAV